MVVPVAGDRTKIDSRRVRNGVARDTAKPGEMRRDGEFAVTVSEIAARNIPADAVLDLVTALRRAAGRWPNRAALVFDETGETLSFSGLALRVDRVAAALAGCGIARGDRIAIMLPNRMEWPLAWLALARLGAVMVPVNTGYRTTDAGFVLRHAGIRAVVTMREFVPLLLEVRSDIKAEFGVLCIDGDADGNALDLAVLVEARANDAPPVVDIDSHTLVNIQYTSGTTGEPKGCMLSNSWFMRFAWRVMVLHDGLDDTDTILTSQPFYYVDPQWNLAVALLSGATLVVLDRFHPSTFWQRVRAHRVTWFYCLGVMPKLMLNTPPSPLDRDHSVKRVICSAIPRADHADIEARWGVRWYEAFGMTESGLDVAVELDDHDEAVGTGCIGTPMPGREARVVDADGRPVPAGTPGELVLRGVGLMDGYYCNPAATAAAFRNGWLHTGDIVRRDERGRLYYLTRLKDMIRRSGENIAAAEVEDVVMRHPGVRLAAVLAVEDELRGEEVLAYVVPGEGMSREDVNPTVLSAFCAERLARFKVPRYWKYRDDLPRTPSERIRKEALREEHEDPKVGAWDRVEERWR